MKNVPFKLVSALVGVLSGLLARTLFKQAWKLGTGQDEVPKTTDAQRRWSEVLLAAVAEGVIAAVVKTLLDRGAAQATAKMTGSWPEA
jgi:Protein of unknown function (DUF4235)